MPDMDSGKQEGEYSVTVTECHQHMLLCPEYAPNLARSKWYISWTKLQLLIVLETNVSVAG